MSSATPSPRRSRSVFAPAVLGLSVLANLALLAGLRPSTATPAADAAIFATNEGAARPASAANHSTATKPSVTTAPSPATDLWRPLETEDLEQFIARLRAAGFDEELVRAIVWDRISRTTNEDATALEEAPYWRRIAVRNESSQRRRAEYQAGEIPADIALFEALFGEKPNHGFSPDAAEISRARDGLSPKTRDLVDELRRQRDAAIGPNRGGRYVNGEPDEATRAKLERQHEANLQFDAALRAQLSPADYESYLRNASETAQALRSRSGMLQLTQAEFDTLLATFGPAADLRAQLESHASDLTAALGEDRFAEFSQALSGDFQTNRVVERLGLPASTAIALQGIRDDTLERSRALGRDRSLNREEQQAQRLALGEEARQRLAATLPPEGLELYLEHAGQWMGSLQPPPAPPPGP